MTEEQRHLAKRILAAIDHSYSCDGCLADMVTSRAWLRDQGAPLLRAALAEIERLENRCADLMEHHARVVRELMEDA